MFFVDPFWIPVAHEVEDHAILGMCKLSVTLSRQRHASEETWQASFMSRRMATRKDVAVSFLQQAASGRVREAYGHVSKSFRHHNPFFAADAQALMAGMEENARQNPEKRLDVLHTLEDGDLVAVHSRVRHNRGDRGAALVHLFRFEGDRIAELWDIGQEVPAEAVNTNGMF